MSVDLRSKMFYLYQLMCTYQKHTLICVITHNLSDDILFVLSIEN